MDRYDVAPIARLMLALYAVGFLYLLFAPSPPRPPSGGEMLGHFALFFGLGLLTAWSLPELAPVWRVRIVLIVGALASGATELVQGRLPTRMFEWSDLAANLVGTMAAAVVVPLWSDRIPHAERDEEE